MEPRHDAPLFEKGDRVAVLGLGLSGLAASRLLHALGAEVYASDSGAGPRPAENAARLREEGIDAETGRHDLDRILSSDLVVTSPGVGPSTEIRRAIDEARIRTVAEIELAFRHLRSRVIGITGTNGKTTTTALCGHLLESAGLDSVTAGNIGRPLADVAMRERHPDWVVVELSSFQLADLETFRPAIGLLLNLAPDHLDRYASLDRYFDDKARLFANADADSRWVLNADDPRVMDLAHNVPGERVLATLEVLEGDGATVEDGWLVQRFGGETERWLAASDLHLVGRHNVMNSLLAGLAAALAGCGPDRIGAGLATFRGLPHRLQPVGEFGDVLWINDSKGTNVAATRVALGAFERPLVVLLGGRHKGEPYTSLLPELEGRARSVIAFGEAAPIIVRELSERVPLQVAGGLDEAVRLADELSEPGDVVLFSPACSSYDMFPDYEERGRAFEQRVLDLHDAGEVS